jgi:hypothetical protein
MVLAMMFLSVSGGRRKKRGVVDLLVHLGWLVLGWFVDGTVVFHPFHVHFSILHPLTVDDKVLALGFA